MCSWSTGAHCVTSVSVYPSSAVFLQFPLCSLYFLSHPLVLSLSLSNSFRWCVSAVTGNYSGGQEPQWCGDVSPLIHLQRDACVCVCKRERVCASLYNVNVFISIWKGYLCNLLLTDLPHLIKVTKWPEMKWDKTLSFSFCLASCSVFLLDRVSHELVAKVFDGGVVSDEEVQHENIWLNLHTFNGAIWNDWPAV